MLSLISSTVCLFWSCLQHLTCASAAAFAAHLQYKTTVARIQLDNSLDNPFTELEGGQQLTIACPSGVWSEPYGVWDNWNEANAMLAAPVEGSCPEGHYAQRFYIKPSQVTSCCTAHSLETGCSQQGCCNHQLRLVAD
jgi:hypothetical protein